MKTESKIIMVAVFVLVFLIFLDFNSPRLNSLETTQSKDATVGTSNSGGMGGTHISTASDRDKFIGTWQGNTSYGDATIIVSSGGTLSISANGMIIGGSWQLINGKLRVSAMFQTYDFNYAFSNQDAQLTLTYGDVQWILTKML